MQPNNDATPNANVPARGTNLRPSIQTSNRQQAAAQHVVRGQIDTIYQNDPNATQPINQEQATQGRHGAIEYKPSNPEAPNPYERTHDETKHQINQTAWDRYHSAWQNYYQQYYERYYISQVYQAKVSLEQQAAQARADTPITEQEAIYELRTDLISKVKKHATKARKSRHFWPLVSALAVMGAFILLQYNQVIGAYIYTYIRPGGSGEINHLADPTDSSTITPDDRLVIPRIGVNVPIVFDAVASNQASLNAAMNKGVAWFNVRQAHSKPGENGNFVVSGHSSNDWAEGGEYKFVFGPLEQMQVGDTYYVNYQQHRYIYKITSTKVVAPTDVGSLTTDNSKPIMTLITCTPLGTDWNRLLVFAEQISPDPSIASTPATNTNTATSEMPKNAPTLLEKLLGATN